ncbi:ATP-binding cassette permease mdl1 [Ceratobasidium sp. 395]|nr:ATP-binding cassette permease mdl1 [Ceratobasidium sp. 395]
MLQLVRLAKPEKNKLLAALGLELLPASITPTVAVGAIAALFTLGALANFGRIILIRSAGANIVAHLRVATYTSALRQDVEYLEKTTGPGDILSRLNADAYIVGDAITENLSDGVRAVVSGSIGLSMMLLISPSLTGIMLVIVPPISLGAFLYGKYLKQLSNDTQEALGDMSKVANEALSAIRTVQAFTAAPHEQKQFRHRVNHVRGLVIKEARASAAFFGASGWAGEVVELGLLVYVMSKQPAPFQAQRDFGDINFENVCFAYPSRPGVRILEDFSMTIRAKGDSVAIV